MAPRIQWGAPHAELRAQAGPYSAHAAREGRYAEYEVYVDHVVTDDMGGLEWWAYGLSFGATDTLAEGTSWTSEAEAIACLEALLGVYAVTRCACGAAYDVEQWAALGYVGEQEWAPAEWIELRNCVCGSTLGRRILRAPQGGKEEHGHMAEIIALTLALTPFCPGGKPCTVSEEQESALRIAAARPEWALQTLTDLGFTEEISSALRARFAREDEGC